MMLYYQYSVKKLAKSGLQYKHIRLTVNKSLSNGKQNYFNVWIF